MRDFYVRRKIKGGGSSNNSIIRIRSLGAVSFDVILTTSL